MKLKALSMVDMLQLANWRNQQLSMLRTTFPLTNEMQAEFYKSVVCNRQANARFWGIWSVVYRIPISGLPIMLDSNDHPVKMPTLIGMCGLENIQWENRLAEISLLLNPEYSTDEYLSEALRLVLHQGFINLNLQNIFTEVYWCNPNNEFWMAVAKEHKCRTANLPERKYWNGSYYGSVYINFNKERYLEYENTVSEPTHSPD